MASFKYAILHPFSFHLPFSFVAGVVQHGRFCEYRGCVTFGVGGDIGAGLRSSWLWFSLSSMVEGGESGTCRRGIGDLYRNRMRFGGGVFGSSISEHSSSISSWGGSSRRPDLLAVCLPILSVAWRGFGRDASMDAMTVWNGEGGLGSLDVLIGPSGSTLASCLHNGQNLKIFKV